MSGYAQKVELFHFTPVVCCKKTVYIVFSPAGVSSAISSPRALSLALGASYPDRSVPILTITFGSLRKGER